MPRSYKDYRLTVSAEHEEDNFIIELIDLSAGQDPRALQVSSIAPEANMPVAAGCPQGLHHNAFDGKRRIVSTMSCWLSLSLLSPFHKSTQRGRH